MNNMEMAPTYINIIAKEINCIPIINKDKLKLIKPKAKNKIEYTGL